MINLLICFLLLVTCPSLTNPTDGMINCSLGDDGVANTGEICTVTCDDGYELSGSATRTCQSSRSWNGSDVTCTRSESLSII